MSSLECQVCLERFNEAHRKPRCLCCGHTICNTCIEGLLQGNCALKCPLCRTEHNIPIRMASQIPINFTVMDLLQEAVEKVLQVSPSSGVTGTYLLEGAKQETQDTTKAHVITYDQDICLLEQFQTRLQDLKEKLVKNKALVPLIGDLLEASEIHVTSEETSVSRAIDEGRIQRSVLIDAQSCVNSAKSTLELTSAHQDVVDCHSATQEWISAAQNVLNCDVIHKVEKFFKLSSPLLDEIQFNMSGLPRLVQELPIPAITLEGLEHLLKSQGQVMAMKTQEEHLCHARLILHGKTIFLCHLQTGMPSILRRVEYDEVVQLKSNIVFLELSWGGQTRGRVYIMLQNQESRTLQFQQLCSGEKGPSYVNTHLLKVLSSQKKMFRGATQQVWGGDIGKDDGSGGMELPGMTTGLRILTPITEGAVVSFVTPKFNPTQFGIFASLQGSSKHDAVVGQVIKGLEKLKAAVKLPNIRDVVVSECGLVLQVSQPTDINSHGIEVAEKIIEELP